MPPRHPTCFYISFSNHCIPSVCFHSSRIHGRATWKQPISVLSHAYMHSDTMQMQTHTYIIVKQLIVAKNMGTEENSTWLLTTWEYKQNKNAGPRPLNLCRSRTLLSCSFSNRTLGRLPSQLAKTLENHAFVETVHPPDHMAAPIDPTWTLPRTDA